MNRKLIAGMVAMSLWGAIASQLPAAESLFGELYGRGVHAYNQHNYEDAYEQLTAAIEQGSRDPRTFFYRGLVFANTGRPELAKADFQTAAMLEITNDTEVFNVSKSLERVQGTQRLEIEKYRRDARVSVAKKSATAAQARYEQAQTDEAKVLRKPAGAAVAGPAPMLPPVAATEGGDPFGNAKGVGVGDAEKAPEKVVEAPAAPAGTADPFAETKPAPATPAAVDPFGGNTTPAPAAPAPAAEADPFGEAKPAAPAPMPAAPAGDDPFGEAKPAAPAPMPAAPAGDDPFGEAKPAAPAPMPAAPAGDDPFGEAKPAAPAPMPAAPAGDDPFGEAKPAAPAPMPAAPAGDDPFGEAKPAAPAPMPAAPAGDDPFGEAKPAAPADGAAEAPAAPKVAGQGKKSFFGKVFGAGVRSVPGAASPAPAPVPDAPPAPAGNDPFGAPPAKPAAPAPAGEDPFGAAPAPKAEAQPAPAAADPFADDPQMEAKPAAPAPAAADPFGDAPAAPAKPEPKASDDPFGI
ncbi:MAG TPA: hypothetical protein VL096_19115 [Pirellulaceae bacterium]|nr:hypothetical protein [Pirellulaceae bacterium]